MNGTARARARRCSISSTRILARAVSTGISANKPTTISLKPLMFETFVCTLAMMSFVALIGPLARTVGLVPWQAGAAMTVGGIAWVWFSRIWGHKSDRRGRRRVLLQGLGGFVLSHAALCAFMVAALEWLRANQQEDGLWGQEHYTGGGFPRVFYLRYHGYARIFPLWALARLRNLRRGNSRRVAFGL